MEIKDYLHFYIGCLCKVYYISENFQAFTGLRVGDEDVRISPQIYVLVNDNLIKVKPILRKLSDMTEEEGIKLVGHQSSVYTQVEKVASSNHCFRFSFEYTSSRRRREWTIDYNRLNPEQFHYLLKQGFDLFGLIDAGLAIDNKSL